LSQRALVIGVKLDARALEDVCEQQLGGQPRSVDVLAREEPGSPFQNALDRPWPTRGTAHGRGLYGKGDIQNIRPGCRRIRIAFTAGYSGCPLFLPPLAA